jgi:hypothetical protein
MTPDDENPTTPEDLEATEFPPVEFPPVELEAPPAVAPTTGQVKTSVGGAGTSLSPVTASVPPAMVPVPAGPSGVRPFHARHRLPLIVAGAAVLIIIAGLAVLFTRGGDPNSDQAEAVLAPAAAQAKQVLDRGAGAATIDQVAETGQAASAALNSVAQAGTQVSTIQPASARSAADQALEAERTLLERLAALKDTRLTKQSLDLWTNTIRGQIVAAQDQLGVAATALKAVKLSRPELAVIAPTDIAPTLNNLDRVIAASRQRVAHRTKAPRGVLATVTRTCGSSGAGDCFLSLRTQPNSTSPEIGRVYEGHTIRVVCQIHGENAHSSALGASTPIWSRDAEGDYMSNAYLTGGGLNPYRITLPACR